ncbi:MAG: GNAT family N-acetyltransferase [Planctomycetota bacterium]
MPTRFRASKSQRRVWRRNADLEIEVGDPQIDEERLDLYHRFHEERAQARGWPDREISSTEYIETFVQNAAPTLEFRYRLDGRLVGIAYVGRSSESLNSIYAFTDPDESRRSLGTFDVLAEIEYARSEGLRHVYLGFLVRGCGSMEYKSSFRPHQLLSGGGWRFSEGADSD